ncbi:MAG: hypothetical protein NC204_03535 [Candidatus Amulumruptor caecigallinarius]|nr:hypothetical protein [Candidatus Amulumruptor caecigallinarius]
MIMHTGKLKFAALAAILLISIGIVSSCKNSPADRADERIIAGLDSLSLPIQLKNNNRISSVKYADKVLTLYVEVSPEYMKSINAETLHVQTANALRTNLLPRNFFNNVVTANATVDYVYVCGSDSVKISIKPEELH